MDITPLVPEGRQIIEGYGNGGFRIGGTTHAGSLLVFPEHSEPWDVASFDVLTLETLAPVIDAGLALDFTLLPLIDLGVHGAYNTMFPRDDGSSLEFLTLGAHAALVL